MRQGYSYRNRSSLRRASWVGASKRLSPSRTESPDRGLYCLREGVFAHARNEEAHHDTGARFACCTLGESIGVVHKGFGEYTESVVYSCSKHTTPLRRGRGVVANTGAIHARHTKRVTMNAKSAPPKVSATVPVELSLLCAAGKMSLAPM